MPVFDLQEPYMLENAYPAFSYRSDWVAAEHAEYGQPRGHSAAEVQRWLLQAQERFDIRSSTLARRAGLAPSTLNKFLSSDTSNSGAKNLSATTIDKLTNVLKEEALKLADKEWEEIELDTQNQFRFKDQSFCGAYIVGDLGQEFSAKPSDGSEYYDHKDPYPVITAPVESGYERLNLIAFQVETDAHAPVYIRNDILICVPLCSSKKIPSPGAHVIVHHEISNTNYFAEVRQYVVDPASRDWLMPVGDLHTQQSHAIFAGANSSDNLKATAVVLSLLRAVSAQKSA